MRRLSTVAKKRMELKAAIDAREITGSSKSALSS